jgi:hypothetical protein
MRFVLPAAWSNNGIIHDFGWLRIDNPSPNFTIDYYHLEKRSVVVVVPALPVEPIPAALVDPGAVDEAPSHSHAAKTTTNNNANITVDDNHYSGEEAESDDDEL